MQKKVKEDDRISLGELCRNLSITVETGKNWIKTGKMNPCQEDGTGVFFSWEEMARIEKEILQDDKSLKQRRNKRFLKGNGYYADYLDGSENEAEIKRLLQYIAERRIIFKEEEIRCLLAEAAVCMLQKRLDEKQECGGMRENEKSLPENYRRLVMDLCNNSTLVEKMREEYPELFQIEYVCEPQKDVLGLLYLSLKQAGQRKAAGAYYTPEKIVKRLVCHAAIPTKKGQKILDPCCGSGSFLLHLPETVDIEDVYGNDLDKTAVCLARINLAIRYLPGNVEVLYRNITEKNFLTSYIETDFAFIIGNPPWGFHFEKEEKKELKKRYYTAGKQQVESFNLFVECAVGKLKQHGTIAFILPEAVLAVKAHSRMREFLKEQVKIDIVEYLGEVFHHVQCPSLILKMKKSEEPFSFVGTRVKTKSRDYVIRTERTVKEDGWMLHVPDDIYALMEKIQKEEHVVSLKGNSIFALGIVTGDNRKRVFTQETIPVNQKEPYEKVLKGSDVFPYRVNQPKYYIAGTPDEWQQTAPLEYYRISPKLVYRFIADRPVVAYEPGGMFTLNSCNILIPMIEKCHIKYILAVLNSEVVRFLYRTKFRSQKVLRSYLEELPIPVISEEKQNEIVDLVNALLSETNENVCHMIEEKIHLLTAKAYGLTEKEYLQVKNMLQLL